MKRKLVIFTDIGDTIIDEGTEVRKVPGGVVYEGRCLPGAKETFLKLYEDGYPIVMVADGLVESFHNLMRQNGLDHIFSAEVISEPLGVEKPAQIMFENAMKALQLGEKDKRRVLMIGNNIARDMVGANRFGIRSVQMICSDRYPEHARNPEEQATYQIRHPSELLAIVEELEKQLQAEAPGEAEE